MNNSYDRLAVITTTLCIFFLKSLLRLTLQKIFSHVPLKNLTPLEMNIFSWFVKETPPALSTNKPLIRDETPCTSNRRKRELAMLQVTGGFSLVKPYDLNTPRKLRDGRVLSPSRVSMATPTIGKSKKKTAVGISSYSSLLYRIVSHLRLAGLAEIL